MKNTKMPLFLVVCMFITLFGAISVFATQYETSVLLGPGYHLDGAIRSYSAGSPSIQYTLKYFNKYNNQNYSKFNWKVIDEDGRTYVNSVVSLSHTDIGISKTSSSNVKVAKGKYRFYFSTKVDGTTYSGIEMKPVYLSIA